MKLFQINGSGEHIQRETMYQAFGVPLAQKQVIAFVGAGGKTTSIYHLAKELASLGKRVIITTTTHMYLPTEYGVLKEDKNQVFNMLSANRIAVVGTPCENGKMTKVSDSFFAWMRQVSDYVLVEADGSKRLPIKVPDQHEPVFPLDTDMIMIVAGLSCLFRPIQECCHRWKLAAKILHCEESNRITPGDVAKLLIEGYCNEQSPPYKILLNQCEGDEVTNYAIDIMKELNESQIIFENIAFGSFLL